jgi:hypothetical protein
VSTTEVETWHYIKNKNISKLIKNNQIITLKKMKKEKKKEKGWLPLVGLGWLNHPCGPRGWVGYPQGPKPIIFFFFHGVVSRRVKPPWPKWG